MMERDYYKQIYDSEDTDSLHVSRENGLPVNTTPVRSPSVNADILELKKKNRQLQEQL